MLWLAGLGWLLICDTPAVSAQAFSPLPVGVGREENKSEIVILDTFQVIGSRVLRSDTATVSPVLEIGPESQEAEGFTDLGGALRALPFNNGRAITPTDAASNFAPGLSSINFRGLKNNSTLILINGRRVAPYAEPAFDGFQSVVDLDGIPSQAIEGIEILKDGGSAIYGSDAVAGVVNFRMRRDYSGTSAKITVANYFNTDGLLLKGSVVAGNATAKTSMFTAVQWQKTNSVFARDLTYAADADKTSVAGAAIPAYRGQDWASAGFASEKQYVSAVSGLFGLTNPAADGFFDNRSSRGFPGSVITPAGAQYTFAAPTAAPTLDAAVGGFKAYNYQTIGGILPQYRSASLFFSVRRDLTARLHLFSDISYSQNHSLFYSAGTPVDIEVEHGLTLASRMVLPSYNPYNPWGADLTSGRRRLVELPMRTNEVTSKNPRVVTGLGGKIGGAGNWNWEAAVLYSKSSVENILRGTATDLGLQEALMGLTRNPDGSLFWNPATPLPERVYFNWFGNNDPAFAKFLSVDNPTTSSLRYLSYDISATGSIADLPGGRLGVAVGAETAHQQIANVRSDLSTSGGLLAGEEGTSSFGSRRVSAIYAEADLPVTHRIELQVAGRFEKYSDRDFAQSVRPKIGLKYQPVAWLTLRGSFSQSFKAPDLPYLYTSALTTFMLNSVRDPVTRGVIDGMQINTVGNPALQPERTDTIYLGVKLEPRKGALQGWELSVDWFDFRQRNLLALFSRFYPFSEFLIRAAAGDPAFANRVVRDPATNNVLYVIDGYENLSRGLYRGMDFAIRYRRPTRAGGDFHAALAATWLDRLEVDGKTFAGGRGNARFNATAELGWGRRDWAFDVFGTYRGPRKGAIDFGPIFGPADDFFAEFTVKSQIILNASVAYGGFRKCKIILGVSNFLNRKPPLDPIEPIGTTPGINDAAPAMWQIVVRRDF